jgi:lysophospholipid acyltransferase (LPLAT)-like uncharacterized protein
MSSFSKALKRSPALRHAAAVLIWMYIRFVCRTSVWRIFGHEAELRRLVASGAPVVVLFWHGRLAMPACFRPKGRGVDVLISAHGDGALIAAAMRRFGLGVIEGSSSKGGSGALRRMVRALQEGRIVAVTPDGPRGPCMKMKGKALEAAAKAGAYVVPVSYSCSRAKILRSWDRFLLPLPFSRGAFCYGMPTDCTGLSGEALKKAARAVEEELHALTVRADREAGRIPS